MTTFDPLQVLPFLAQTTFGPRRLGAPKGGKVQNFAFFFLLPPQFSFFLPLLGIVSWNVGGV